MFKLILMQGAPGSGKSTMAARILSSYMVDYDKRTGSIRSADEYWYKVVNPDDPHQYDYDPALAGKNHIWNQHRVLADMMESVNIIIVDNTNTLKKEANPYVVLAKMFDYEVESVRVDPGLEVCLARNALRPEDRRVPEEIVRTMHGRMESLLD